MPSNEQRRQAAKRKLERQLERRAVQAKRRRTITIGATIVVVIAVVVGVFYFTRTSDDTAQPETPPQAQPEIQIPTELAPAPQRPTPLADPVSCQYRPEGQASKPVNPPANGEVPSKGTVQATINTNQGAIPLTLDRSLAPCTVNSFVSLAEQGFYNETSCHRIGTTGLQMLQCGDPSGSGSGGPGYSFDDETFPELQYGRGYLAMANSGPNTNGSQFFMVFGEAPLSPDYTVFGTITEEGLKVIDDIARAGDDGAYEPSPGGGKPNKQVNFQNIEIKA
ncbi:peptidyl-prolyl cis-trans isomerase B (cyclophilin B) [Saccharopolyspora antimicrobica]|uniref:Peptidyl-prolyl cis-trans isomerase n=1 Tax=Saccharopolyspora antimicrobica TaxID=455193 RepID=A0A1I5BCJ9_9PSEU|nr:peptidylprolyl isomerase [Saccharopolyspora antimicrobica]RKT86557.1 peptidyl-prolyl cis-trans isomerase B (cyclophilin B) [Saccharopolyspora antimicrobica]SFN72458.1 peptidyl-prolyl cis-trans isomerase B (cyclophilin B) [Saccharopolyspora antimicrobica]